MLSTLLGFLYAFLYGAIAGLVVRLLLKLNTYLKNRKDAKLKKHSESDKK